MSWLRTVTLSASQYASVFLNYFYIYALLFEIQLSEGGKMGGGVLLNYLMRHIFVLVPTRFFITKCRAFCVQLFEVRDDGFVDISRIICHNLFSSYFEENIYIMKLDLK